MKDWKEKLLSQAGKEVLIKAVIQAIPTYPMNCFMLPITTCQEIERATSRFFWGSTLEERKYHWASWDVLTTAKAKGGIGFRELHFFNMAMLAKQVWNLIQHPESLAHRMLKAKYFRQHDLLNAKCGGRPSYLWRSLIAAKDLVMDGQAWRIGDGKSAYVKDRWIGVEEQIKPNENGDSDLLEARVEVLIDNHTARWREEYVKEKFLEEEAKRILSIPLSTTQVADRRIWRLTPHDFFSVKSAYHLAVAKFSDVHTQRPSPSVTPCEWKNMWKIDIPPRVKIFLWRACVNALPSKVNLSRRQCKVDPICSLCGEEEESTDHLFLRCEPCARIWYQSALRLDIRKEQTTSFREFVWKKMEKYPREYLELLAYTAWEIWKKRCMVYMENGIFNVQEIIHRSQVQWQEYANTRSKKEKLAMPKQGKGKWRKPSQGSLKLNCDVAVIGEGKVGLGFVIRDASGTVVLAGKKEEIAEGSSTLLEGHAMRYALKMAKQYGLQVETVECDSKNLVEIVNGKQKPPVYSDVLVMDIRILIQEVGCNNVDYIPRENNQVAHHAARGIEFICIRHSPNHLNRFLLKDVMD